MAKTADGSRFAVEEMGESSGHCDCCGNESRCVCGMVHDGDATLAAYWMNWTVGHLGEQGANLDLILGRWGDDASAKDRVAVSLLHRQQPDGSPALIDAADRPVAKGELAQTALTRSEVVGTSLAAQVLRWWTRSTSRTHDSSRTLVAEWVGAGHDPKGWNADVS